MNRLALALALITVALLEVVLLLGAGVKGLPPGHPVWNGLILALDVAMLASSGLLGHLFRRQGRTVLGLVFFLNLGLYAMAFLLRISGIGIPLVLLFAADLYWLTLYLVCLASHWRLLAG